MRGVQVPDRTEDFTADPVELFFDLAYVFAFSQLVGLLVHHPTWAGVGDMALLFALLWLPWQELTWAANAVSGNGRPIRVLLLIATAVSVPMAASTSTALHEGGPVFAVALSFIMVLGFAIQGLSVERGTSLSQAAIRWIAPNVVAIVVLVVGAFVEGDGRLALWGLAVAIVIAAMVHAGKGEWIIRTSHFAERHGLIVIIALGEVVVAIGLPVVAALEDGKGIPGTTVAALAVSGAFAGLLWWSYFDRPGPALEHRGEAVEGDNARGRYARDVYTWAHAPIVAGVILIAAALEEITLHPSDHLSAAFRAMLAGGMALMLLGVAAAVWRAFAAVARERVVAAVVIGAVAAVAASWDGLALLVAVVAVLAAMLVVEHARIER